MFSLFTRLRFYGHRGLAHAFGWAVALCVVAGACSGVASTPGSTPASTPTSPQASVSPASASPSAGAATFVPATSVKLEFDDNAQVVLTGSNGRRVFIDVYIPAVLPKPELGPDDILLTTHLHEDHYQDWFINSFPGPTLTDKPGSIKFDDVTITGLLASHDEGPMGSDHIFVIDIAGLRIVHFGDCGQTALTDDQLTAIGVGKVDVAISQTSNPLSNMDATNQKGINLMKQVQPKIFVPTHYDDETITEASKVWPTTYSTKSITLARSMIPAETTMLIMGQDATYFSRLLNLKPSGW